MNQRFRSVLSIMTIGIFLLLAYASVPSNSGHPEEKCDSKYNVNFDGKIELLVIDKVTKAPIQGANVNISYSCYYGRLREISGTIEYECTRVDECFSYPFIDGTTDEAGKLSTDIVTRIYYTDLDGTNINISVSKEGYEENYVSFYRSHKNASPVMATIELLNKSLL